MQNIDDIVAQVQIGNKSAFEDLLNLYQTKIRGFCYNMVGSSDAADDLAQEVFIKVYRNIKKFRFESSFSTWIFRVARNHCYDYLRKNKRQPKISWDGLTDQHKDSIGNPHSSHEKSFESQELLDLVLSDIDDKNRDILILKEYYGFKNAEIAKITENSEDAVKSRLKRVKKEITEKLRPFLEKDSS